MKHMSKKGKIAVKSRFLGAKYSFSGLKKYELATNLERQNGAKRRPFS